MVLDLEKVKEELRQMIAEGKEISPSKWELNKKSAKCKVNICKMELVFEGKAYSKCQDVGPEKGVYGNFIFSICRKCGRPVVRLDQ